MTKSTPELAQCGLGLLQLFGGSIDLRPNAGKVVLGAVLGPAGPLCQLVARGSEVRQGQPLKLVGLGWLRHAAVMIASGSSARTATRGGRA